jgi:hypothetical protein
MKNQIKIYTKFGKQPTIMKFLELFFDYKLWGERLLSCETYFDKECTEVQCERGKYRSIEELLMCIRTYYTNVSFETLMRNLCNLKITREGKNYYFRPYECHDIKKTTVSVMTYRQTFYGDISNEKQGSFYSCSDCFKMGGLHNQIDYTNNMEKLKNNVQII